MGQQIGVEVTGVDVKTLDDQSFAPIYQAWLDYNVMVVRDQDLPGFPALQPSLRAGRAAPVEVNTELRLSRDHNAWDQQI
jgi:taurine dioxygenase